MELLFASQDLASFLSRHYENRIPSDLLENEKLILNQCLDCGFVWQVNTLIEKYAIELYSEWVDPTKSYQKSLNHNRNYYKSLLDDVFFVSLIFNKEPRKIKVLDFGMGWGNWSSSAISMGMDVFSFELSSQKIEYAKKRGINVVSDLSEYEDFFDYVHAEQVLEHLDHPLEALSLIKKVVKPGGVIRLSVPNFPDYTINDKTFKAKHDALHPLEHLNTFTKSNLNLMARKLGLKVLDIFFFLQLFLNHPQNSILIIKKLVGLKINNTVLLRK